MYENKVEFIIKNTSSLWKVLQKDDALSSMLVDMIKREQASGQVSFTVLKNNLRMCSFETN
jgi:hypothetical protein